MKTKPKMKIRTRISIAIMSFAILYIVVRVIESIYMTNAFTFHLFDAVLLVLLVIVIVAFMAKMGRNKQSQSQPPMN